MIRHGAKVQRGRGAGPHRNARAAAWTWRDIQQQPTQRVLGSKTFWRISSTVNTLGSVGYWLIDRHYQRSQAR